ncbi:Gfo/Idh/MocA family protein [Streptomyces coeruleorubidus]|uniref:Gfo/Idh/MocA family protein n=1 Tax=Streptomyces coeruleorubidus TaxID=116188 RepID=UPI0037A1CD60
MGVLGCASIARRRVLPALDALPCTEIAAIASRDPGRAGKLGARYGCRPVHGYADLLRLPDVDAVYVPLPAALHAPWVEAALRAGKHVLAEKPLTTDAEQTRALVRLAAQRGLVLRENVMFVHHPQHARVRALLRDGAIGRVHSLHAAFAVPELPAHDIRYQGELGGGALFDVGIYPLRAAAYFLGDRLTVAGAVLSSTSGRRVDTGGAALLSTPEGTAAHLTFGLEHLYRSEYEIRGSHGRITVDRAFTPAADHHPVVRLERDSGVREIRLAPHDQVAGALTAFATAVRSGGGPDEAMVRMAVLLEEVRHAAHRPAEP